MIVVHTELAPYSDEKGNVVRVGRSPRLAGGSLTFKETGASVVLGDNVNLAQCHIVLGRNSVLEIGDNCKISGTISIGFNSRIKIGSNFYVTSNVTMRAVETTEIIIGDDCLLGTDVAIRTTDGHPIYDMVSRERLNASKSLIIGNHVWVADDVLILKGAGIGDASVVGAKSVLTKSIPNNCIAAGNPARIVKTGTTWEHSPKHHTEQYYASEAMLPVATVMCHRIP